MKTLLALFIGMDNTIKYLIIFEFMSLIVLTVLHHFLSEKHKKLWLILSAVPLAGFIILFAFDYIKGNMFMWYQRYAGLCVIALIIFIWGLGSYFRKSFKTFTVIAYVLSIFCFVETIYVILVIRYSPHVTNFSHYGWTESFEKMVDEMEDSYVLGQWKDIDFDRIRTDYIPKVEKAEKENDKVGFLIALYEFKYELFDGHVWIQTKELQEETVYSQMIILKSNIRFILH